MGQNASQPVVSANTPPASCPMHTQAKQEQTSAAQCPVDHSKLSKPASAPSPASPAPCPVDHSALNQMPVLSQNKISENQTVDLPTIRTTSSIPRDPKDKWEYPSPQQFYNALARKGWETPEEHVESMVEIHNWLNEAAWNEVLKWERRASPETLPEDIQLARFQGKPGQLSPKAQIYLLAGWLFPSHFNDEPPFDRHDWVVRRPKTGEEVRYVIDYYSAPPEADGNPVFSLDVRPALDSFGSIKERIAFFTEERFRKLREDSKSTTA